ncbi:RodZ family helix-turn-helix domain-containing protein [Oceanobacter kriegii]|uniref:hypothetical protein n=1 Tax=Oceanobacter kriegii TaxID=64972 RepID=UPI0003FBDADA|nr:hypothetical protein [Oceanobacter kriegii]
MNSKLPLHGPGVYLLTFRGARKQAIFRSVFELEAAPRLLANLPDCKLIAWLLDANSIRCVLRCAQDWPAVVEVLQQQLSEAHEAIWGQKQQLLSEQVDVLAIDESAFLMDTVLQLHRLPVFEGKVPSAELYPWSSDRCYRMHEPPAWLDCEAVLNRLSHSRHRREQHYINVMEQPAKAHLNLNDGNQPMHLALARDRWMERHVGSQATIQTASTSDLIPTEKAWAIAVNIVASRFGVTVEDMTDSKNRRVYQRLMPLAAWLLNKHHYSLKTIESCCREDVDILQHWVGRAKADHPTSLCKQLLASFADALENPESILPAAHVTTSAAPAMTGSMATPEASEPSNINTDTNAEANTETPNTVSETDPTSNAGTDSEADKLLKLVQPTG